MNRQKFLLAMSLLARVASGFATLVLIARALDPSDYGLFVTALAYSQIVATVTDFGFSIQVLRDIGGRPERAGEFMAQCIRAKNLLVALGTAGLLGCVFWLDLNAEQRIVVICLYLSVVATSYSDLLMVAFRGTGRYGVEAIIVLVSSSLVVVSVTTVSWLSSDLRWLALSLLVPRLFQAGLSFVTAVNQIALRNTLLGKIRDSVSFIKTSSSIAFDSLLNLVTAQLDVVAVSLFLGLAPVANYQIAARSAAFLLLPSQVFSGVYLPSLSRAREAGNEKIDRMENRYILEYALVGVFLAAAFATIMPPTYQQVFGGQYEVPLAVWLGFSLLIFFRYLTAILGMILISRRDTFVRVLSQIIGATLLAVLLAVMVPTTGLPGGAWALAISIGTTACLYGTGLARARRQRAAVPSLQ